MKRTSLALAFSFAAFIAVCQSRPTMDFETYDPPSTLVVPQHIVTKAKFPFIDIHNHQPNMGNQNLAELTSVMDTLNMAVMINLSGSNGSSLKKAVDNVKANAPKRFVVFANIDFDGIGESNWTDNAVKQLEQDVRNGAQGLKIFKNLGFSVKDNKGNRV